MNLQPSIHYNGRYDRGLDDACPFDHSYDEKNIQFSQGSCGSRYGFDLHLATSGGWNGNARRVHVYERVGEALRLIILDNLNNLWDSTNLAAAIHTFVGVAGSIKDFALMSLYNRAYITPHDGITGVAGEHVYVYDGTRFRAAAGAAPAGHTLVGADGAAGKVEKGNHLFAVCFETESGHITRPGLEGTEVLNFVAPGSKKVHLTGIPTGPAGTTGRHIVATPILGETYNGNPKEQEWFFVPNGHLAENTETQTYAAPAGDQIGDLDFYDADLIASADYLQYQQNLIPAGCALADYQGRLVIIGDPEQPAKPWVSSDTEPESISEIDGFTTVDPGDGGGCKNAVANRGILYITKSGRFYSITDNGEAPASWRPDRVDASIGAEPNAVGRIGTAQGAIQDTIFVADRTGIYCFPNTSGSDEPLTWKIGDLWNRINSTYFYLVQIVVDPSNSMIYCNVPLDASTECDYLIVGDYKQGLSKDSIRWSVWDLPNNPTTIWMDTTVATGKANFRYGCNAGSLYKYTDNHNDHDDTVSIDSYIKLGYYPDDSQGFINQFTDIRLRVCGSGVLVLGAYGLDSGVSIAPPSLVLSETPGKELSRKINISNERVSFLFQTHDDDHWFTLYSARYDMTPEWSDRPQV